MPITCPPSCVIRSTAAAAVDLITQLGGQVIGMSFLVELRGLNGRARLSHERVHSAVVY